MKWPPDIAYTSSACLCPRVYLDRVLVTTLTPPSVQEESWAGPGDAGAHPPDQLMVEVRCQHWASRAAELSWSWPQHNTPASTRPLHCTLYRPGPVMDHPPVFIITDSRLGWTSRIKWSNTIYLMSSVPPPWMSALSKAWYFQNLYPLENNNNI